MLWNKDTVWYLIEMYQMNWKRFNFMQMFSQMMPGSANLDTTNHTPVESFCSEPHKILFFSQMNFFTMER